MVMGRRQVTVRSGDGSRLRPSGRRAHRVHLCIRVRVPLFSVDDVAVDGLGCHWQPFEQQETRRTTAGII